MDAPGAQARLRDREAAVELTQKVIARHPNVEIYFGVAAVAAVTETKNARGAQYIYTRCLHRHRDHGVTLMTFTVRRR